MTARTRFGLLVAFATCAVAACSLNPQPFPPDNPDGSLSKDATPAFGDAAGGMPDANGNDGATGLNDDGGDADAESDAGDASARDGDGDASDDGAADATPSDASDED